MITRPLKLTRTQLQWLTAADRAYAEAFDKQDGSLFAKYGTSEAVRRLTDFYLSRPDIQMGLECYRMRTWEIVYHKGDIWRIRRRLEHKNIKLHHQTFIKLGDTLDEIWTVVEKDNKMIVDKIEKVEVSLNDGCKAIMGSFAT